MNLYEFIPEITFIHIFKIGTRYEHMNSYAYEFRKTEFMGI